MNFSDVSKDDIGALIDALGGRLRAPYSAIAIKRLVTASHVSTITERLIALDTSGFSAEQIKLLLQSVLSERLAQAKVEDTFDLVTTGPEGPGITNRDTAVVVRNLFSAAETSVLVVGYAVYQGQQVFGELASRMQANPNLNVQMHLDIRRDKDSSAESEIVKRFVNRFRTQQWPADCRLPQIYYDPRSVDSDPSKRASLHAKVIVVDSKEIFISSANFTQRAQHRNVEVGIRITSEQLAAQLESHFAKLVEQKLLRFAV